MKSKLHLKKNPTLKELQTYVQKMTKQRGFDGEVIPEKFMLLLEECGEFAKAARKTQQIKKDKKSRDFCVEHEAADVFIYLLDICNRLKINLEEAFRAKEEKNKKRIWDY